LHALFNTTEQKATDCIKYKLNTFVDYL